MEVVNAVIKKGNKILTVKRKNEPWPGMFALPGGRVKEGEDPKSALKRELKEETGLKIGVRTPCPLRRLVLAFKNKEYSVSFYKAEIIDGERKPQRQEIEEIAWLSEEEFIENLKNNDFPPAKIEKLSEIIR